VSDLIIEARSYNPNLRALAVLNFADAQGDDNEAAASALSNAGAIEFLDCPIGRRKAFPNAAAEGRGVVELKRADPKATAELSALTDALFQLQTQTVAE
jgi:chromosome partitioning protein